MRRGKKKPSAGASSLALMTAKQARKQVQSRMAQARAESGPGILELLVVGFGIGLGLLPGLSAAPRVAPRTSGERGSDEPGADEFWSKPSITALPVAVWTHCRVPPCRGETPRGECGCDCAGCSEMRHLCEGGAPPEPPLRDQTLAVAPQASDSPEQGDRPTPIPEGDPPWAHPLTQWRHSEQGCWAEPNDEHD